MALNEIHLGNQTGRIQENKHTGTVQYSGWLAGGVTAKEAHGTLQYHGWLAGGVIAKARCARKTYRALTI